MNSTSNTPPHKMSMEALADRSLLEMHKFRGKKPSDERYCLELLRRALVEQDEAA